MLADICSDYGLEFLPSEEGKAGLRNVLPPYAPPPTADAWEGGDLKEAYPASLSILARGSPPWICFIVSQDMPSNMADEKIAQFSDVAAAAVRARRPRASQWSSDQHSGVG